MSSTTTHGDSELPPDSDRKTTGKATEQRLRGIRSLHRSGARSPFGVEWRVSGVRKTEWFGNEADRDRRVQDLAKQRKANALGLVPTRGELQDWRDFKNAIGNTPWQEVVTAWKQGGGKAAGLKAGEAVTRYLAEQDERLGEGKIAKVTHKKNCPKARAFSEDFSHRAVTSITAEEIEEWIDDLGFEAAETFNTYRKIVHAVFESCRKECPHNPASEIELRDDGGDVEIISVEQTEKLFRYAAEHYRDIVPRLALEAFAGLRFSSAMRVERADLNFEDRGVLLPARKLKTGRRHYIDGLPENLWDWLALETPATWALSQREYRRLKSLAFTDAEVAHPHNCLRHGFCTYHVAAFKNAALTSTLLCHRDQDLLWSTYNGQATQRDGLRYFELRPAGAIARKPAPRPPAARQTSTIRSEE